MKRSQRRAIAARSLRQLWHSRACVHRAVTLRVNYVTADGRVWLGLVRNLSSQGMYIDSAWRHVTHAVTPGELLTMAVVLPSRRPCKLRAVVVHSDRHGCGVQFREGHTQSLTTLAHYWASLGEKA